MGHSSCFLQEGTTQVPLSTLPVPDLSDVTDPSLLYLPRVSFSPQVSQSVCVIQTEGAQFFGLLALPSLCAV